MNLSAEDGATITLYAQWKEANHVTITYKMESDDGNGNNALSNSSDSINPITGAPEGSIATASKEYDFIGWYDETGKLISNDEKLIPMRQDGNTWANSVYTARFARKTFNVSFLNKDGQELKRERIKYGQSATAPNAPAINGYEFVGWSNSFDNVTEDVKVTATYRELPNALAESQVEPNQSNTDSQSDQLSDEQNDLVQTGIATLPIAIPITIIAAAIAFAFHRNR